MKSNFRFTSLTVTPSNVITSNVKTSKWRKRRRNLVPAAFFVRVRTRDNLNGINVTDGWELNGTTSVPKSVLRWFVDKKKNSGLYHRHLVNGMDVIILTSLEETNVHCYLSLEYLRNWWHKQAFTKLDNGNVSKNCRNRSFVILIKTWLKYVLKVEVIGDYILSP